VPAPRFAAWTGACLAAPAVALAVTLTGIETYRLIEPHALLFGGSPPETLAESILDGFGVEETVQFIRRGQDPNEPIAIDDTEYTGGGRAYVSPLMLAVAAGDGSAVRMLLSFGARLELPQNRYAECLARESRNPEASIVIAEYRGAAPPPECGDSIDRTPTPLMAWAARSDAQDATDGR
jgi:hypothetical protein